MEVKWTFGQVCTVKFLPSEKAGITLKQWADLPPAGDSSLAGVLTKRRLQKEDWDPTSEQEDEVRYEESTCTHMRNKRSSIYISGICQSELQKTCLAASSLTEPWTSLIYLMTY